MPPNVEPRETTPLLGESTDQASSPSSNSNDGRQQLDHAASVAKTKVPPLPPVRRVMGGNTTENNNRSSSSNRPMSSRKRHAGSNNGKETSDSVEWNFTSTIDINEMV